MKPKNEVSEKRPRILVVDDHQIVRQGLTLLISEEPEFQICGEAASMHQALSAIESLKPDLVIVDLSLEKSSGMDLVKAIRQRGEKRLCLVLSMHDELIYAERAIRAGANGYVMKREASKTIQKAIRDVLMGKIYVSDSVKEHLLQQLHEPSGDPVKHLTNRELEVFRWLGKGWTTRQIASEMHLSVKTIESYRERIKGKLGLNNATKLVQSAIEWLQDKAI